MKSEAERLARSAGWVYSYRWLDRLVGFVSLVVLARILSPDDFGVVAIAASYVAVVEGLSEFDVKNALIQSRDESRALYDSAWTLSSLRGLLTAGALACVAPFVGDPRVTAIVFVLAFAPLLDGLSNPRFVMFERDLVYSRLAVQTLSASVVSLAVTLIVAVVYRSYWALVLGIVAGSLVRLALTFVLSPYRPRFTLSRWRDILRFSAWMSLATVVSTLAMRTDRIIVGRILGFAEAGAYYMTQRIGVLPTSELIGPLQRVLFPSFSQIAGESERLRRAVCESLNVLGTISLSASIGFALVANDFVPLVLGDAWLPITPLLVTLVPLLGLRAASSSARACVMALGRTALLFRVSSVYALVHLPVFVIGTLVYGLRGAIGGIVLAGFFYIYLNFRLLQETVQLSLREALAQLFRPLASGFLMVVAVIGADRVIPVDLFSRDGSFLSLAIKVGVGAAVFVCSLIALWRLEGRPDGIERRVRDALARPSH